VAVSERERTAHVLRRLSMGPQPELASSLTSSQEAISRSLDLSTPASIPPVLPPAPPAVTPKIHTEVGRLEDAWAWWFARMASPQRMIDERLVWFWTDHFAISMQKVRSADLAWQYHSTIRRLATGSFADLLHAVARDGAMLVYLDGVRNSARQRNENFAREVMELHTLGRDHYTQSDVVAASRAFTGWIVRSPYVPATERAAPPGTPEFGSYFIARRHDGGTKTLLGVTGQLDLDHALDVILSQPATAIFVATKMYRAFVGLDPDEATVTDLAATFRRDWSITSLVHAIVERPAFRSDAAVRTITRSPVEKLVGLAQAAGGTTKNIKNMRSALTTLYALGYLPFFAPNPAGYPSGSALIGPQQLVHAFDLLHAVDEVVSGDAPDTLARFGIFDAGAETRAAMAKAATPRMRTLLALGTPEFAVR
jgi:uncharacterized protein (DUF1800 family)